MNRGSWRRAGNTRTDTAWGCISLFLVFTTYLAASATSHSVVTPAPRLADHMVKQAVFQTAHDADVPPRLVASLLFLEDYFRGDVRHIETIFWVLGADNQSVGLPQLTVSEIADNAGVEGIVTRMRVLKILDDSIAVRAMAAELLRLGGSYTGIDRSLYVLSRYSSGNVTSSLPLLDSNAMRVAALYCTVDSLTTVLNQYGSADSELCKRLRSVRSKASLPAVHNAELLSLNFLSACQRLYLVAAQSALRRVHTRSGILFCLKLGA